MNNDNSVALSKYRLEKSKECLKSAKALRDIGDYQGAANRSYYAMMLMHMLKKDSMSKKIINR